MAAGENKTDESVPERVGGAQPKLPPIIEKPATAGLPPVIDTTPDSTVGQTVLRVVWGGWMANPFGMKIQFRFGGYENEFDFKKPFEIDLPCEVGTHQLEIKIWIRSMKRYPIQIDSPGFYLAKLKYDAIAGSFSSRIFLSKMS